MNMTACWRPLVASFSNVNSEIIVFSVIVMGLVVFCLRKELALLDVITLGKEQAINLGVDYDRCIRRLLLGVTLFIAVETAMVGPISFLGTDHCKSLQTAFSRHIVTVILFWDRHFSEW